MSYFSEHVTNVADREIIQAGDVSMFVNLSSDACSYTKAMMNKYAEHIWQDTINREYQTEGFPEGPKVSLKKLEFPSNTSRKLETMTLSLFYPNNLLNVFLNHFNSSRFTSPMCTCQTGEQDSWHLLTECPLLNSVKQSEIRSMIAESPHHGSEFEECHLLVSWLRTPNFLNIAAELMEEAMAFVRSEIVL